MDPVYGYESINVESQERSPFSLLQWMKRMIALRRQHPVFGRGSLEFIRDLEPQGPRSTSAATSNDIVLCVANLSRTVQPVEIPLGEFAGLTPVELLGQTEFPRIGEQPYFLTLAPYGFYWFQLQEAVVPLTARTAPIRRRSRRPALALRRRRLGLGARRRASRSIIERQALVPFLERQRWFGGKARPLASARIVDWMSLRRGAHPAFLTIVEAEYRDGGRERYVLPLAMSSGAEAAAIEQRTFHRRARAHHRRAQRPAPRRPAGRRDVPDAAGGGAAIAGDLAMKHGTPAGVASRFGDRAGRRPRP